MPIGLRRRDGRGVRPPQRERASHRRPAPDSGLRRPLRDPEPRDGAALLPRPHRGSPGARGSGAGGASRDLFDGHGRGGGAVGQRCAGLLRHHDRPVPHRRRPGALRDRVVDAQRRPIVQPWRHRRGEGPSRLRGAGRVRPHDLSHDPRPRDHCRDGRVHRSGRDGRGGDGRGCGGGRRARHPLRGAPARVRAESRPDSDHAGGGHADDGDDPARHRRRDGGDRGAGGPAGLAGDDAPSAPSFASPEPERRGSARMSRCSSGPPRQCRPHW